MTTTKLLQETAMNQKISARSIHTRLTGFFLVASIVALLSVIANAQTSATDGSTPAGMAPGAPAGSYQLSGFENVNFFNGNLNFNLPLLKIGGRGGVQDTIGLKIEQKWRTIRTLSGQAISWPVPVGWEGLEVGYGPGVLIGRLAGTPTPLFCGGDQGEPSLMRLTFKAADGTEYELHDTLHNGDVGSSYFIDCNLMDTTTRGKEFVSADGTSMTFVSDDDLYDAYPDMREQLYPSGYLLLRDGTRYRIENGLVMWIRDRNGNQMMFEYDGYQVTKITDSLGRAVNISNAWSQTYPYSDTITYKGSGGASRTIRVWHDQMNTALRSGYTLQTYHDLFPLNGASTSAQFDPDVVTSVELPDGRSYHFKYNSYGELARVELPTGGAFEYDYDGGFTANTPGMYNPGGPYNNQVQIYRRVVERRVYPDGSTLSSRMTISKPEENTNVGYAVVDNFDAASTRLTSERHYFYGSAKVDGHRKSTDYDPWKTGREWKTEVFASNGTTLLRRVEQTWQQSDTSDEARADNPQVTQTLATLADSNQVSKQTFAFDQFQNRSDVYEYDYGSGSAGALVRHTHTDYLTGANYTDPVTGAYLLSLPTQQSVFDAAGTERARSTFEYDNYGSEGNHADLKDWSTITGYPTSGLDSSFTTSLTTRGNVTGTTHYLFNSSGTVTGSISAYAQYDIAGNVVKAIDARGYAMTFDFTDRFGAPNGQAENNTSPAELSTAGKCSYAFATKVTNALSQTAYVQFDYYLGRPVDSEDANGIVSSGYYDDALDRPTQVIRAVNGGVSTKSQTLFSYDDVNRMVTTTSDFTTFNDQNPLKSAALYDGLGRTTETRQYESGTNYIAVQTQYDAMGRAFKVSNPFRPWQSEAAIWTTAGFDVLGRVTSVTTPDSAAVTTAYDANFTTVTDQAGKQRRGMVDALGRLIRIDEPDASNSLGTTASPNQPTSYEYDVVGNLLTVTQGSQTRTFTYDSLSRLRTASNPESGTITYTYDDNGNLTTKTDARSIVSTYVYDALNRATSRSYSDSTPTVTYNYDSTSITNGKGRLASVSSSVSSYSYSGYDATGKPVGGSQTLGSQTYSLSYAYDLSGHVTSMTYPSGRVVNYNYDNAGRLADKDSTHLAFTGNLGDGTTRTYAKGISYGPMGQMTQEQFGTTTAVYNKLFYNSRGQLAEILASTSGNDTTFNRGKIVNDYSGTDNNGNLKKQTVYVPNSDANTSPTSWYQQYDYDFLNRLKQVHEYTGNTSIDWQQAYIFDRYGNRTIDQTNTTTGIPKPAFTVSTSTNRLGVPSGQTGTMTYDSAGNLTTDTYSAAAVTRVYDAENRMTQETQASSYVAGVYSYDGDGRRVKRNVGGVETWQVYGLGGELVAEYAANTDHLIPQKEYGYRNGQLLVTVTCATGGESVTYTTNPLEVGSTIIHAVDITELRTAVNQARTHAGLSAATWTDSSLSGVEIKAVHITELRTKLDEARSALGLSAATWTDSSLSGVAVKAVHLSELRTKVAETVTTIDIRWMVTDQLGTPRMVFDQTGSLANTSRHDYLPFGEALFAGTGGRTTPQGYSASDGVRQHFTGYEADGETGLNFAQARYQSPVQGRFTSVDPFGKSASVFNPQTFNRYSYVLNNPLNLIDPTGRQGKPKHPPAKKEGDEMGGDGCPGDCGAPTGVIAVVTVTAPPQPIVYEFEYNLTFPRTAPAPTAPTAGGSGLRFLGGLAGAGAFILANPTTLGGGDTCAGGCCTCQTTTSAQPDTSANPNPEDNKPDTGDRTKNDDDPTVVVRGGVSPGFPLGQEISGAEGISLFDAASGVPHNQIWHTTAGEIRRGGGTVIPWPEPAYPGGPINERHVRITLGRSSPFVGPIPNPVPKNRRVPGRP